ncbi:PREDICTED: uncharacterized protein LOC109191246 [Ipomoea nil]|uniref:uncharacterized protein LOC109191246 n=1 Tax=Ipomoea nil TaxID=35883 RepID=UPI000900DE35|nr:PREDICTED: uncharacterized protein LOC109191246 [Ipomoea nil]
MESEPTLSQALEEIRRKMTRGKAAAAADTSQQPPEREIKRKKTTKAILNSQNAGPSQPQSESQGNTKKRKRQATKTKDPEHKSDVAYFSTRMGPRVMHQLVKRLSEQQKQAVTDIGFESILRLQLNTCESQLVQYLVHAFDVFKCDLIFEGETLHLAERDIECTLGIPRGVNEVEEAPKYEENGNAEYVALLRTWRQRWGIQKGSPITTRMGDAIIQRGDYGDEFKRDFMVLLVSSMLRGFQTRYCNYRILNSLINVGEIKNYNWCSYTYKFLIKSIDKYRKKSGRLFTGAVTFLLLFYVDRVQFKGMRVIRTHPTILSWTTKLLRKRVDAEKNSGGFGKGKVIPRMKRPTTVRNVSALPSSSAQVVPTISVPSSSIDRVTQVLQRLAADVIEFGEAMTEVGREGAPAEVIKKTFSGISNMISVAGTMQAAPTPTASQLDDIFFGQESFTAAVDALVEAFQKTTKQMEIEPPSFDLGISLTPAPLRKRPAEHSTTEEIQLDVLVDSIACGAGLTTSNNLKEKSTDAVSTSGDRGKAPLIRVPFTLDSPATPAAAAATTDELDEVDR